MGLISHVAARGTLDERFATLRQALLDKPVQALRLTQQLLRAQDREEILARMTLENGHFSERLSSDEVKQAIASFFANRRGNSRT